MEALRGIEELAQALETVNMLDNPPPVAKPENIRRMGMSKKRCVLPGCPECGSEMVRPELVTGDLKCSKTGCLFAVSITRSSSGRFLYNLRVNPKKADATRLLDIFRLLAELKISDGHIGSVVREKAEKDPLYKYLKYWNMSPDTMKQIVLTDAPAKDICGHYNIPMAVYLELKENKKKVLNL